MDKQTLSSYGWVVIVTLVLVVMIALATPFGTFVGDAVSNTIRAYGEAQTNATDESNIDKLSNEWEGKLDFDNIKNDTVTPDPALNPDDGIIPRDGDVYTYGDYKYTYYASNNGWSVAVLDINKTEYGAILESINGQPVTDMSDTFRGCTALATAPIIPNNITNMLSTFRYCDSLTTAPVIPDSVINMDSTFFECYLLETAPTIPSSVTNMNNTFCGCTKLTGNIEINATPKDYDDCFFTTDKPITLSGTSVLLAEIAATSSKGNVTVIE